MRPFFLYFFNGYHVLPYQAMSDCVDNAIVSCMKQATASDEQRYLFTETGKPKIDKDTGKQLSRYPLPGDFYTHR